jgi:hypothetical protein
MDLSWKEMDERMCLLIERMIEKTKCDFTDQVSRCVSFLGLFSLDISFQSLCNVLYGISLISFDSLLSTTEEVPCHKNFVVLNRVVSCLLSVIPAQQSVNFFNSQVAIFIEVIKRSYFVMEKKELALPVISIPYEKLRSSPAHQLLFQQLEHDLKEMEVKEGEFNLEGRKVYEIANEFEGIRKGLFSVDMAVKKNNKLIGFVEIDGDQHYRVDEATRKKKLRRKDQLKEALYRYDYPDIPFLRFSNIAGSLDVRSVSKSCISRICNAV